MQRRRRADGRRHQRRYVSVQQSPTRSERSPQEPSPRSSAARYINPTFLNSAETGQRLPNCTYFSDQGVQTIITGDGQCFYRCMVAADESNLHSEAFSLFVGGSVRVLKSNLKEFLEAETNESLFDLALDTRPGTQDIEEPPAGTLQSIRRTCAARISG